MRILGDVVEVALQTFSAKERGGRNRKALAVTLRDLSNRNPRHIKTLTGTFGLTFPDLGFGSRCHAYSFEKIERARHNNQLSSRQSRNPDKKEYAGGFVFRFIRLGIGASGFTEAADEATALVCAYRLGIFQISYLKWILDNLPEETCLLTTKLLNSTKHIG
jgi:hypothetical protein